MKQNDSFDILQKQFCQAIINPEKKSSFLMENIRPSLKLKKEDALLIYRRDYEARLTDALGEKFEAVWAVLGDDQFFSTCLEYINETPSNSFDLGEYGQTFPHFLEKKNDFGFPFFKDLADFELLMSSIFHSPIEKALDFKEILQIEGLEKGRFEFINGVALFESCYDIYTIWSLKNEPQEKSMPKWNTPCYLALYQSVHGVKVKSFSKGSFFVLKNLIEEKSIEESINKALEKEIDLTPDEMTELFNFLSVSEIVKGYRSK